MKPTHPLIVGLVIGAATAAGTFFVNAGAQSETPMNMPVAVETAVFAGGCFWCVEADFDKVDGVLETVSGYTGGDAPNPTYYTHSKLGHYEAVQVTYDPSKVQYAELVDYFFRHIDPTDPNGQFCDKGPSYRTAIFVNTLDERATAQAEINTIEESNRLPGPVVTQVFDAAAFWPAEGYHQDYYLKNSTKYKFYRRGCGRDARLEALWGDKGSS
ncbi:MAG: peptide-methionine (S)-S-oxide reductase MsrA [Pseudomonadota bacterium]